MQEVELLFALRLQEQGVEPFLPLERTTLEPLQQAARSGQTFDRAANPFANPLEIAMRHRQIGPHLGDQQSIQVISAPDSQPGEEQRQDHAQRQQGEQQQADADGAPARRG